MEWALIPRNRDEADQINGIVEFFQFYMLPRFHAKSQDFLIGYPYEFEIGLYRRKDGPSQSEKIRTVGQIGRSVVTNVNVDHAGGGKVAFVQDNGPELFYPAVTHLSVSFQEVRLLDRSDFAEMRDSDQRSESATGSDTLRRVRTKPPDDPRGEI